MKRVILMTLFLLIPRMLVAQEFDISSLLGETWYGVYLSGQKSGYSMHKVSKEDGGGVSVVEDARFRVTMSGVPQDMRIYSKRTYAEQGDLRAIEMLLDAVNGRSEFNAVVKDDSLFLRTVVAGTAQESRFEKPKETLRDAFKQMELVNNGAKEGDELSYRVFEPMYQRELTGTSRIIGTEERVFDGAPTKVFKIKSTIEEVGIETISYVAEDGTMLEDVVAGMITTRLEPEEIAKDVNYSNDVMVSNAALIDKRIENPRDRKVLKLRLTGPLTDAHLFNDERQFLTAKNGYYEFASQLISLDGLAPVNVPVTEASVQEWLKPSLLVQSDDKRLIDKAGEIIGEEKNAVKVSGLLCKWVYDSVRTTFTAQLSNSLDVLEHMEGDCTEHSMLFIGLARAAGLPAREVAGLIYIDGARPGFYFHQWATVWVGKWIDVDPTFNQPLADVTHIKLAEGDLFQQAKLIPIIGQIKAEVVQSERAAGS